VSAGWQPRKIAFHFQVEVDVEVEVNLRPTVSRPVCVGVRHPFRTPDQFFVLLEISFRQLRVCYFVALSLTRGRVCSLIYNCFWALPEQSLLGHILLSHLRLPQPGGPGPCIYIPQEQGGPVIPRALGSFLSPLTTRRDYGGGILTRLHTGLTCKGNSSNLYPY
jgi:hypothetical protein